jgi:hypothetical protein
MPDQITVTPWTDPVIDTLGHDPRSWYAETFWLPTLGPTSLLLMRHLGPNAPIMRSLGRLVQFDMACRAGDHAFAVRRNLPPVNRRHVKRLPAALQTLHDEWIVQSSSGPALDLARQRARRVAFTLAELGDDFDAAERALHTIGFAPPVCRDAVEWARRRHREALEAAGAAPTR